MKKKIFHFFEYRCVYDIIFTNITNIEEVIFSITLGYMKYKYQLYGLGEKNKNASNNGFLFNQIVKLTTKSHSIVSNMNIRCHLKLPIAKMHRAFFKIISRKPEFVKSVCNDRNIPCHFACRRWSLYNQT